MSAQIGTLIPHTQEATSSWNRKRQIAELGTSREGPSTRRTSKRDHTAEKENAAPAPDHGGCLGVRNEDASGRRILADSGPDELVFWREATREDFPARWQRDTPFETEDEYERYVKKLVGSKFAMTKKKNEWAVRCGFRDFVHAFCEQIVG